MSSERTGRRPGESGTKEKILSAALSLFATRGYGGTTIRAIAEQAQVDPALVHHFYGNKDGVFRAAVESALGETALFAPDAGGDEVDEAPDNAPDNALADPTEHVVREHLDYWEAPVTGAALAAIYRTGLADETVSATFRAQVEAGIHASTRKAGLSSGSGTGTTSGTDADTAGALLPAHLIGLGVVRHVLQIEPLASLSYDEFLGWILPAFRLQLGRPEGVVTPPAAAGAPSAQPAPARPARAPRGDSARPRAASPRRGSRAS